MSPKKKLQVAGAVFAILILTNLLPKEESSDGGSAPQYNEKVSVELPETPVSPSKSMEQKICKAGIATAFYKSPDIISTEFKSGLVELSYRRAADNSLWRYRCNVEGNSVEWAGFINGEWGRWRNTDRDASITYKMSGDRLIVSELAPGSSKPTRKSYSISRL